MSETVRLAVSNIAWEPAEDDAIAAVLRAARAGGVEIAPTKWRERPMDASSADVAAYRRAWEDRGLEIVSLQALLFGKPELQLFGTEANRAAMLDYLRRVIDFAARVGAHALVFGSPKNRVRGALGIAEATAIATEFFRELGTHAEAQGAVICIEANPPAYGCDFVTTTRDAVDLCRAIDHPGVRVNADLGGMTMSGEAPGEALALVRHVIGHFHASEPNLAELGAGVDHEGAASALASIHYDGWISIEMRAPGGGDNVAAVERAVRLAKRSYARALL